MEPFLSVIQKERNKVITKLKKQVKKELADVELKTAVLVIKRIVELFPKMLEAQPHIIKLGFGMGQWYFCGKMIGSYIEDEGVDSEVTTIDDAGDFKDYIKNPNEYVFNAPFNDAIKKIVSLCDYLVNYKEVRDSELHFTDGLNFSTMIDYIDKDGVVFIREVSPKSPFGSESLASTEKSPLINCFKTNKVPYRFIIE